MGNEMKKVKIKVLLFGGGAGHIGEDLGRELKDLESERVDLNICAFNTDLEDLNSLPNSINKVPIGMEETGGWGAGADPLIGLAAAKESAEEIIGHMKDADITIFVATLGGGTGTGSLPFAVEEYMKLMDAKKDEKLHKKQAGIIIVTMPFDSQDSVVKGHADGAYKKLASLGLPIIPIYNDRFLPSDAELVNIQLSDMFTAGNKPMAHMIGRMVRSLGSRHDIMNIDRNDIVSHLLLSKEMPTLAYYGVGYCKEGEDLNIALEMAATNLYLQSDLSYCEKAIISVDTVGSTAKDWQTIQNHLQKKRSNPNAEWRCGVNNSFKPLPFEEKEAYTAAVFIFGVGCAANTDVGDVPVGHDFKVLKGSFAPRQIVAGAETVSSPRRIDPNEAEKAAGMLGVNEVGKGA